MKKIAEAGFMRGTVIASLVLAGVMAFSSVFAGGKKADTLRVLLIGNSFSKNASTYLPQLAENGGHVLVIGRAETGGCPLEKHWRFVQIHEQDPENPEGGAYWAKKPLKVLLTEEKWDVVTMQQYSFFSSCPATYEPYARNLYDYVRKFQPEARILIHQTWAYRTDAPRFGLKEIDASGKQERCASDEEMWRLSRAAYRKVAEELGVGVIPVGDAFWAVCSDPEYGYKVDATFDRKAAKAPELPAQAYSLHKGYFWDKKTGKLKLDANHASDAGCYLGGLVWYGVLFGESPARLTFVPEGIPADFASYLRKTAQKTLKNKK